MKKIWDIAWRIFAVSTIVFVFVVNGCHSDSPTSTTSVPQYKSVEEETAYSSEYWASVTAGSLHVNIPDSGDFKISYTTDAGSSEVLLRLSNEALVTVTLESDDELLEVTLQKGAITTTSSQSIETFDDATFTADTSFGTLVLISAGVSVLAQPTATPTPATASALPDVLPTPTDDALVVVAIGDSITYGKNSSVGGYPTYLEYKLLTNGYDVDVINEGVSGEESPDTDSRFSSDIQGADYVLLMIGTNDITSGDCDQTYCTTITHISSMLDKALSAGVTPIVSTIIPARSTSTYSGYNDDFEWLNTQIKSLASNKGVRYIDNYSVIDSDAYYSDDIHPNDAGYELLAIEWYWALYSYIN